MGGIKMRGRILWIFLGIFLVVVLALGSLGVAIAWVHRGDSQQQLSQVAPAVGVTHVFIRSQSGDVYDPATIQVVRGTVVTWTDQDTDPHSVVLSFAVTATSYQWTSGVLATGQSASYTFTSPGRYVYHCSLHVGMIGFVLVT
jgi:plastocyanin